MEIPFDQNRITETYTAPAGTEMTRIVLESGPDVAGKMQRETLAVPSEQIRPDGEGRAVLTLADDEPVRLSHQEPIGEEKADGERDRMTVTREVNPAEVREMLEADREQTQEKSNPFGRFPLSTRAGYVRPFVTKEGEPYRNKAGRQVFEVRIPNDDPADKSPWRVFSMDERFVHPVSKLIVDLDIPNITAMDVTRSVRTEDGWEKQTEKILVDQVIDLLEAPPTITMSCTAGLVGDPVDTARGRQCQRVYIPNRDEGDSRPWESFFIGTDHISVNPWNENLRDITVFDDGHTKLSRPQVEGQDEQGRDIYAKDEEGKTIYDVRWVANDELKDIVEAYKTKDREEPGLEELSVGEGADVFEPAR